MQGGGVFLVTNIRTEHNKKVQPATLFHFPPSSTSILELEVGTPVALTDTLMCISYFP
jgi:hypothetical protein